MKWNKFRLKTTSESEDLVSSMLMDLGIQGIEIEDKIPMSQSEKELMFVRKLDLKISLKVMFFSSCSVYLVLYLQIQSSALSGSVSQYEWNGKAAPA